MKAMRARKDGNITFPCIVQIKLDGVRALVKDGVVYSRAMKPIPNKHVQKLFGHLHGFDGELMTSSDPRARVFNETQSAVMTIKGEPEVYFHVYDDWNRECTYSQFHDHLELNLLPESEGAILHPYFVVDDYPELVKFHQSNLVSALEGTIIRNPDAPYRQGTATKKCWELIKWKPKDDAEFEVVGFEELMHNTNGEVGDRSSHKEGMVPAGMLGALILKYNDTTFKVGTGFDTAERMQFWTNQEALLGRMVKVEYEGIAKDRPRFPSFKGFRDKRDIV